MMKEVELGNVCHFENGDRGKNYPSQSAFVEIGIPFISAKDLENNLIKHDNLNYISEETYNKLGSGKLQPNDILFCLRGSLGKFAINKDGLMGGIASSLVLLRAKEDLQINYLKHYLNSPRMKRLITKSDNGSSQPNLSGANVKKFPIPLPPIEQQKKIASILDTADAYRQKTKALIEKYDALTQSLFLDMFGDLRKYDCKPLSEVTNFIDYRGKSPNKVSSGIPLLTAKNVKNGYISEEPREYIPINEYDSWMVRGFPNTGDVLFTTEAPLGQASLLPYYDKVAIAQRLICLQPLDGLDSNFLMHTILSPYFQGELHKRATGSTAKGIRSKELAKIDVPLPPLSIQEKFNNRVKAIEVQKVIAQQELDKADELFNSLLQRAFKGELV